MRRLSFLALCLLFVVIISGVYRVANQYQIIDRQVSNYDSQSEEEHENIRVLQAEWAYLTNPVRLEKLAHENFQLQPVDGKQLVAIVDLPIRATMDAQQAENDIASAEKAPKPVVAAKSLPAGVVPVATEENQIVATAMPTAATQALPPIEATPVSDQREAR